MQVDVLKRILPLFLGAIFLPLIMLLENDFFFVPLVWVCLVYMFVDVLKNNKEKKEGFPIFFYFLIVDFTSGK